MHHRTCNRLSSFLFIVSLALVLSGELNLAIAEPSANQKLFKAYWLHLIGLHPQLGLKMGEERGQYIDDLYKVVEEKRTEGEVLKPDDADSQESVKKGLISNKGTLGKAVSGWEKDAKSRKNNAQKKTKFSIKRAGDAIKMALKLRTMLAEEVIQGKALDPKDTEDRMLALIKIYQDPRITKDQRKALKEHIEAIQKTIQQSQKNKNPGGGGGGGGGGGSGEDDKEEDQNQNGGQGGFGGAPSGDNSGGDRKTVSADPKSNNFGNSSIEGGSSGLSELAQSELNFAEWTPPESSAPAVERHDTSGFIRKINERGAALAQMIGQIISRVAGFGSVNVANLPIPSNRTTLAQLFGNGVPRSGGEPRRKPLRLGGDNHGEVGRSGSNDPYEFLAQGLPKKSLFDRQSVRSTSRSRQRTRGRSISKPSATNSLLKKARSKGGHKSKLGRSRPRSRVVVPVPRRRPVAGPQSNSSSQTTRHRYQSRSVRSR